MFNLIEILGRECMNDRLNFLIFYILILFAFRTQFTKFLFQTFLQQKIIIIFAKFMKHLTYNFSITKFYIMKFQTKELRTS